MTKTLIGAVALGCLSLGLAHAGEPVSGQTAYPETTLEQYWQCKERTDLDGIKKLLWEHENVDRIDASMYGLPPNDFDDHSLLTVDERLWYRKVREDEKNPLPTEGPIQYPHFMREAIDRLYIVNGNRPDCSRILDGKGITVAEADNLLQGGWAGDKDLTSGDSNARGEVHVAVDHATPSRILVSTIPASAVETSNPTWHTTDYGATWTKTLNGNNSGSTWECDPFGYYQRTTGNVYQAKIGCNTGSCGSTYTMMRTSPDNGATWSDCGRPDTATNSDREQYAVDNTPASSCYGKIYMTWHNGNAEQVAVSSDNCATWTKTALTAASQAITPDVGIGADGHVYVAWGNFGTSQFMIAGSANCGSTWNAPSNTVIKAYNGAWKNLVPAQCVRGVATEPLVDVDRCPWSAYYKRVYVIMADYEAAGTDLGCSPTFNNTHNYELWLSYSDDGGATWHKPSTGAVGADDITAFEGSTVDDLFPWLRVDEADGAVYVSWTRSRLAPASLTDRQITSVWAMRSLDGGKTWSTPYQVSSTESSERTSGSSTFERGDYQAMDVVQGVLYPVWIDRRSPTAGSQTAEHPITRKVCTEPAHVSERAPTFAAPPTTATAGSSRVINVSWTLPDIYWGDGGENAAARKFQLWVDGVLNQDNIAASTTSTSYTASDCSAAHTFKIRAINSCGVPKDYAQASATAIGCCANDPSTVDVTPNGPLTLCQGTGQLLSAAFAGGTGPFSYQWTQDGVAIDGATSSTYLANDTGSHAYNCMIFGGGCSQATADAVPVAIAWQSAPTFAGIASVANPHGSTCTLALAWPAASSTCAGPFSYSVYRSTSASFTPSAGNRIASGVTGTSYNDAVGISNGTTYYYIVHAVDGGNGAEDTNTVTLSGTPSGPIASSSFADTFEGALSGGGFDQAGWTHAAVTGTTNWTWSTTQPHDGAHSWFASDVATTSDMVLVSPAFGVGTSPNTTLSFWHTYAFEGTTSTCYDGGTLEYSTDGTTWTVVPAADFTAGAYTGTANAGFANPIGGRSAWCAGTVGAPTQVTVNLGGDASLAGRTIQLRWHEGNDSSTAATGWYVDSVSVANAQTASTCATGAGCTAPGSPSLATATGDCAGVNLAWNAGTGSTGSYNVYRSTTPGGPYALLGSHPTTTGTTYADTTAVAGTTYYYVVRGACDAGGTVESVNSNELSAARLVSPAPTITGASANVCPGVSVSLTTEAGKSNYQWYLGGSPIGGANSSSYAATASGIYTVSYTDASGCSGTSTGKTVTITPCAPNVVYQSHSTITQVTGDGDAYYERGEKWSVSVTLTNSGNLTATNVTATLGGNGITLCSPTASFGTIAPGGTSSATFEFVISPTFTPCGGAVSFNVTGKTSTELTPAGADQNGVFSVNVGQPAAGSPTELVIQPATADTYVNQNAATTNSGTATTMLTNVRTSREEDLLVQFDLSGIPAGSMINSATLELYNTTAPASTYAVNVSRNTATWAETSVTWNTKPAYDAANVAQITPTTAVGWKIWTVTSAVQGWYGGTYTNYGFTVRPNALSGSTNVLYTFATRENATTANRPILRVNYTPTVLADCSYTGTGSCCAAPTGLTNSAAADLDLCADTGVQITWAQDPSDWADGGSGTRTYDVLRNGSAIASGIAYGTTSYTDNTGANGTTYTYSVRYRTGCGSVATTAGATAADNATVCAASDQCHVAGTCDPQTGACSDPAAANGTACNDGNACSQSDSCQAGACVGANPVACAASDQCHVAGSCDPQTGTCSNPNAANGTACNDGDACTQSDSCQAGACVGANPVACAASDQCHVAGTCDPQTGTCSNPAAANGTSCNDGDACTQSDSCQAGACVGANPVTCGASDQCHVAGTCDPQTGACSNPSAGNGTACNDGDACTQSDSCQAGACVGANPVTCAASDQCHVAGTCDPQTGACSNPAKPNGAACSDGNACTQSDSCQAGACVGANPVTCAASDQCHLAGTCNPFTGACSNPAAANGTACSDGNACTQSDSCQAGACVGANPVTCAASDQCHVAGTCDPETGACSNPAAADGTACNDGDACTQSDSCQSGACVGANPVVCAASDQCHVAGACDPQTGACSNPNAADGTACNDGDACTQSDSCQAGACVGSSPVTCAASDQCHIAGVCDPQTGACSNPEKPNGSACNDGNACTQSDSCQAGACVGANSVTCAASDQCHLAGSCDPQTGACSNPVAANGTACDDGNPCTMGDACVNGACGSAATITAPPEIQGVTAAGDKATFNWPAVTYATRYDVVRGVTGAPPIGQGNGGQTCFGNLEGTSLVDPTIPAPGGGFWYLSRGENACGVGTYGTRSDGAPRITMACP